MVEEVKETTTPKEILPVKKPEPSNEEVLNIHNKELVNQIVKEENVDKIRDLTAMFNLNNQKKNILRRLTYEDLLDIVGKELLDRVTKHPDEMSTKDILDVMTVIQQNTEKITKQSETLPTAPLIQVNKINVNTDEKDKLSRDSREKVLELVNLVLGNKEGVNLEELKEKIAPVQEVDCTKDDSNEVKNTSENINEDVKGEDK